jgi:hypothetical protein
MSVHPLRLSLEVCIYTLRVHVSPLGSKFIGTKGYRVVVIIFFKVRHFLIT